MRIKNKLKKELDGIVKSFDENKTLSASVPPSKKPEPMRRSVKVGLFSSLSAVAALCIALTVMLALPRTVPPVTQYLTVEINPSVAFTLEDGIVKRVSALNADCDVVLSDGFGNELIGKNAESAAELFTDRAARLGYIDLDGTVAVRVGCDGVYTRGVVKNALDGYFKERGVFAAVAAVEPDKELLTGLDVGDEYVRREIAGKSAAELEKSYSAAVNAEMSEIMRSGLSARIDEIEKYKGLLAELAALDDAIEGHADNPVTVSPIKDYFVVKEFDWLYPSDKYTEEFARLMGEFETKLGEYAELDVSAPTSGFEIKTALSALELIPYDTLRALADGMSKITSELYGALADVLKYTGFDIGEQLSLIDAAPTTEDEYVRNMETLYAAQAGALIRENARSYEKPRDAISDVDYDSFVREIIDRYGSLDDYFVSSNNKNFSVVQ